MVLKSKLQHNFYLQDENYVEVCLRLKSSLKSEVTLYSKLMQFKKKKKEMEKKKKSFLLLL